MRQHLQILLAATLILIAGYVGYVVLFGADERPAVRIVSFQGEVVRTDAKGQRSDVTQEMELRRNDTLSVGESGLAVLGVGEGTRLTVDPSSSMKFLQADETGVRIELEEGRVKARVRAGSGSVGIGSRGRGVIATDADFVVRAGAEGALAVESERGEVTLEGFGDQAVLAEGSRLAGVPGKEPVVQASPKSLLLEVVWPEDAVTREAELTLEGRTDPYAEVRVSRDGEQTLLRAGADGHFRAAVALEEGANPLKVMVRDVMGEEKSVEGQVERDTTAPTATSIEVIH